MAGRIPQRFIDDLMQRVDIVDVIDAHVPLKKAGKDYKACCPFHEEKTPSFTVSPDKQFYHCFGCGAHGTAIGFLMEYEHMDFREAVADLAGRVGLAVPIEATATDAHEDTTDLASMLKEADVYYRRQLREHTDAQTAIDYLKRRGLSGRIAAEFGLGYAPDGWDNLTRALGRDDQARRNLLQAGLATRKEGGGYYDRFRGRVMFPIHDYRGRLVGFGGRVLGAGEPKYLNSPETPLFHKGRELYGLFRARSAIQQAGRALVVEGYMDVVALAQFGIDYAVATLGTATTREQLERLFRYTPEVVFCFDGDRAGREAAWRALENTLPVLREGRQASFLFLPEGEDPDSYVRAHGVAALTDAIARALPLPEFLFQSLSAQVDLNRLDGRARLAELARPLLSNCPQGVLRQMLFDRLAEITRMDGAKLTALIADRTETATTPRERPPRARSGSIPPRKSLLRETLALLVVHPELARLAPDANTFADLDLPGADLLVEVLGWLQRNPDASTGALIEHFRGSDHQRHLEKLALQEHVVGGPALEQEFTDALQALKGKAREREIDRLLEKAQTGALSDAEKHQLRQMRARH